ncbi:D-hexose-6-phosphate mutarotase [Propionibacteriaceae bacterium Y1923]
MSDLSMPEGMTLVPDPLPTIRISTPAVEAAVAVQGAQLVGWQPAGAAQVLYLSDQSRWEPGAAVRGGIPVCFPWFAAGRNHLVTASGHPDAVVSLEPAHGWARVTDWQLTTASVDEVGTATLTFELHGADQVDAPHPELFPEDATLRYTLRIGAELDLELEVVAGTTLLDVETLLHTYLAVEDISEVRVTGLDGTPFWSKVTQESSTQDGDVVFAGPVDQIHDTTAAVQVVGPQRTIEVTTTGSSSTVVWNPWSQGAATMADMPDEDYRHMVCVESGNVVNHALTVGPGESHVMTVNFRVS